MQKWSPISWLQYSYLQAATYADEKKLNKVVEQLSLLPPLVTSSEIKNLKREIARAGRGDAFILQGGDCAESFNDCRAEIISNKLKIILQMSLILLHGLRKPIIRVGRIAGQYAKPRSSDYETINGITLPSYRGDLVNSPEFTPQAREPNPKLLLQAYNCSAVTLNYIRSLLDSGFASLNHPQQWDLGFVEHSKQKEEYQTLVKSIADALEFLDTIDGIQSSNLSKVDFYTSHEALHLHYEQALTRKMDDGLWYNLSTHLPWIGMRTAQIDSAHLEFLRGVENPIGIKIGPGATPEWLEEVLNRANPQREEGRLLLFTRLGVRHIEKLLPPLIDAVKKTKIPVTWSCDPMHGNTETTSDGIKTRHFDNILLELKQAWEIHRSMGSYLGGVHFELTGDNVTECIGGARGLAAGDLKTAYHSLVDPRLNYEQSIEMAIQLSRQFRKN
ncbi:3-deoxy-7-phosphoheptulonate synthase class II [Legionella longbeachae]|uniref:Phospho-2-dehydro-3-deoxyheptonate aldolase n=1 Tax=Legionella longbeachae serogroup 1 (strain NSW150) TaxID=661367 RepID=D3HKG3_LEGLN|nr:3-deoxy-7-phosphoheptulonate synthase class II [Legionella longbeachae]VEE03444.1 3-deoxy-D-arabinoheptulosonate-7-phosphate synthase [Legionella oakridgensis]HBD7397720.1 3-deoxy-7-phosphoheptulonate synthase [Legionella pneumophila]ARB93662.1 3-deoxy-7-phosphoheptulonate synthase [Legionella longbeachae]ARM33197.1 3-deoxy-7-phosphoheptulonate synthase [Legionella longbeachae]EEZ93949.1 phospho-2-dehydro-3-deoxyheptonate aldolase 1 [Legionella longbeachae D-4968]